MTHTMEALGGRGIVEERGFPERSMDGDRKASAIEPELPREMAGGFEVIESDREQLEESVQARLVYVT